MSTFVYPCRPLSIHRSILEHQSLGLLALILSPLLLVLELQGAARGGRVLARWGGAASVTHHGHGGFNRIGAAGICHATAIDSARISLLRLPLRALRAHRPLAFHGHPKKLLLYLIFIMHSSWHAHIVRVLVTRQILRVSHSVKSSGNLRAMSQLWLAD